MCRKNSRITKTVTRCHNRHQFVGEVTSINDDHSLSIEVKNRFAVGDTLELMTPEGNIEYLLDAIHQERNGESLTVAPGSGHRVRIPVPDNIASEHIDRGLLLRRLDKAIQT